MTFPPILVLLRPHQWAKNAFVLAPLFFTPAAVSASTATAVLAGMLCFCAIASAIYVANDYVDRRADRKHPDKCERPLAKGTVSVPAAMALMALLLAGGLAAAYALSLSFFQIVLLYLAQNLAYIFWLKHIAIVDVLLISIGFVLRVEAGAALVGIAPSVWILICTGLLALFLGLAKRRDDVVKALGEDHRKSLEGYNRLFLDVSVAVTLGALLVSYAIYTADTQVMLRLGSEHLYLTLPFVLAGVLRFLQITLVEERSGAPTRIALTDRFMLLSVVGWIAMFTILIYR